MMHFYIAPNSPCTEAPVKSFLYHAVPDFTASAHGSVSLLPDHMKPALSGFDPVSYTSMSTMYKYSTRFDGLLEGTEYTVSLSTELDGKTITQVTMEVNKAVKEQVVVDNEGRKGDKDKEKDGKKKKK